MDFLDAVRLLWRRWLIVSLGIVLTGLGCAAVISRVQTVYQASAQYVLLLPAQATGENNPQNPLINQPPGLVVAASLIAAQINTPDTVRDMANHGFDSSFAVALAPQSGPLLTVQATDTDPAAAVAQRDELLRRLDQQLALLQSREIPGVPHNQVIRSLTTAANHQAEAVPGAKIKALVLVVGAGAVVTLLLAFGLDGALTRRSARRRGRRADSSVVVPPEPEPEPEPVARHVTPSTNGASPNGETAAAATKIYQRAGTVQRARKRGPRAPSLR